MSTVEASKIIRDEDYYLQNAIFQVEDRLFKVPIRNFIQESEVFAAMFQLPQNPNSIVEGETDGKPIRLDGIRKEDFKQLLRVMYARAFAEEEKLTEGEWESVLVVAAHWEMDRFRHLAIKKLGPSFSTEPYKLVVMGREHNVDWLVSGILLLVLRKEPMGDQDVHKIGVPAVLNVSLIREWILQWKISHRDSTEWIFKRRPPTERLLLRSGRHSVLTENNR
ncbi:hypothetical protein M413DRAFT_77829 [Hebeloma cylindrosporum]|uniref:BTB domain-containing protein n=1 Tax=Hebeloma cylindrosporum TaxID=76867 RepID=A0A0C2Y6V5_HEBCY|nr:hypothetical protein M413DRAFT_77829 [Hebeloma cylindrosporum h7]